MAYQVVRYPTLQQCFKDQRNDKQILRVYDKYIDLISAKPEDGFGLEKELAKVGMLKYKVPRDGTPAELKRPSYRIIYRIIKCCKSQTYACDCPESEGCSGLIVVYFAGHRDKFEGYALSTEEVLSITKEHTETPDAPLAVELPPSE